MPEKSKHIPVNTLPAGIREGIYIARTTFNGRPDSKETVRSHRDNGFVFILQEEGTTQIEIDFREHHVGPSSIIFIHPDQVHRLINFEKSTNISWIITRENLRPEFLKILEELTPVSALGLNEETFAVLSATAALCIQYAERKQEKLYEPILKESCNTLVALVLSQFLNSAKSTDHASRFELITKSFKALLEQNFKTIKSPKAYAEQLHITTPYLNECVKAATGHAVSTHIQQRAILEAKRLLYYSNSSVKEIAAELGYDDHSYFIRLFVKLTRMTPLAFRSKNFD